MNPAGPKGPKGCVYFFPLLLGTRRRSTTGLTEGGKFEFVYTTLRMMSVVRNLWKGPLAGFKHTLRRFSNMDRKKTNTCLDIAQIKRVGFF